MDDLAFPPDAAVGNCLQDLTGRLAKAGANLKTEKPDIDLGDSHRLRNDLETMTLSHTQPQELFDWAKSQLDTLKNEDQSLQARWVRALTANHRDWNILNQMRAVIRQRWADYFKNLTSSYALS